MGDVETAPQLPKPRNGVPGKSTKSEGESRVRVLLFDSRCFGPSGRSDECLSGTFVDVKYLDISASVSAG